MPDAHDVIDCPWCGAENGVIDATLGILGPLAHYRCRHCGGDFSRTAPTEDDDYEIDDI